MASIDLDKYKSAWKHERRFAEDRLPDSDIRKFMQSASGSILTLFKRGLIIDISFKIILLVSFAVLAFLTFSQRNSFSVNLSLIFFTLLGMIWQVRIYKAIPSEDRGSQHLAALLHTYLDFYYKRYIYSLFIGALSGSLLFLSGSLFYLHFKYGRIPVFRVDDFVVTGIALLLSYGLGAVAQVRQSSFQVRQLEKCLSEIEEDAISEDSIRKYKSRRLKNIILISIALIAGLVVFLFLLLG